LAAFDGGQKGVIFMDPLLGGAGVTEVQPGWTPTLPWVRKKMCPSTEPADAHRAFAADVLRNLLRRIDAENENAGRHQFLVSHAWTEGPMMYLVYTAPPSDRTWGLVRDTRQSIIDPGPWPSLDEAVLYHYLIDLEENWPGRFSRQHGQPDTIGWSGDRREGLPRQVLDIDEAHRYASSTGVSSAKRGRDQDGTGITEPRRYGNRT
jgi:hypothetical protein